MQLAQTENKVQSKSWQDEYRQSLKSVAEINTFFNLNLSKNTPYTAFIPITFAQKIKNAGLTSVLAKQFLPTEQELNPSGRLDPIGDKVHAKSGGIIHRYQNRILFTPTTNCPIICRYCFRKNELSAKDEIFKHKLCELKEYLLTHTDINEVILTGGDPLILTNKKLAEIFQLLSELNIKFVRIHTRTPIILPTRIDNELCELLNYYSHQFSRIIFCLHVNHPDELDTEIQNALNKLRNCKIDKRTQTVLLKEINNCAQTLVKLFYQLIDCDFTPYYLHHPDQVKGAMHFHLPLIEGRKIYNQLRNILPGWAIPHYVIDHYHGHGKQLAFNPESFSFSGKLLDKTGKLNEMTSSYN